TDFLAVREARNARYTRMKTLKATRSVRWATFRDELARLSPDDLLSDHVQEMIAERETWPRTDALLSLGEARLSQHIDAATDLCTRLTVWIENHADSSCIKDRKVSAGSQEESAWFSIQLLNLAHRLVTASICAESRASPMLRSVSVRGQVSRSAIISWMSSCKRSSAESRASSSRKVAHRTLL
ncbi:MAG: hypothetical protein AAFS13_11175, partial [Pseudomonadota bacterium]